MVGDHKNNYQQKAKGTLKNVSELDDVQDDKSDAVFVRGARGTQH